MTNGNSAELARLLEETRDYVSAFTDDREDGHIAESLLAQIDLALSVCADGGKDSSGAEPVEESDVRPKERLCGGSHVTCNGVDYCLGHPSCRDIAKERAEKDEK
jgi:hypothetical protein